MLPCRRYLRYCGALSRVSLPEWPWHAGWVGKQKAKRSLSKEHISWVGCYPQWQNTPCSSSVKESIPLFSRCRVIRIGSKWVTPQLTLPSSRKGDKIRGKEESGAKEEEEPCPLPRSIPCVHSPDRKNEPCLK